MEYIKKYNEWLGSDYIDEFSKKELKVISNDIKEIEDRFFKDLEFGTGGLRGLIGTGTNRMNIYTVRKAAQGLSDYLIENELEFETLNVTIAYDSRNLSEKFAKETANVLLANGIKVFIFEDIRSTPELSFTVSHLKNNAGVVITASHNPAEYNGFKVYGKDGGQITNKQADYISKYINRVEKWGDIKMLNIPLSDCKKNYSLEIIGKEIDDAYINKVKTLTLRPNLPKDIKIVYTPLHGTGLMPITKCLKEIGYSNVYLVDSQIVPDGNFPTILSPNPENPDTMLQGIQLAQKVNADIVIGTDPDCDRVGIVVKSKDNDYHNLNGNQIGALLVNYILSSKSNLTKKDIVIKTIVTSDLGTNIAKSFGVSVAETLTGFKYIGEKIKDYEKENSHNFIFGYEESYGYLAGTFVRDKDAVISSMLIVEMVAFYKENNKTLFDVLNELYLNYGYYLDELESFTFKGNTGSTQMNTIIEKIRTDIDLKKIPKTIKYVEDFSSQKVIYTNEERIEKLTLPKSNVLKIHFIGEGWLAIRPSGTEPKLKIYYSAVGTDKNEAMNKMDIMKKFIKIYIDL